MESGTKDVESTLCFCRVAARNSSRGASLSAWPGEAIIPKWILLLTVVFCDTSPCPFLGSSREYITRCVEFAVVLHELVGKEKSCTKLEIWVWNGIKS